MSDAEPTANQPPDAAADSAAAKRAAKKAAKEKKAEDRFAFTDDGCRLEIRIGALLMMAAVFLWLWLGPTASARVYIVGAPIFLVGVLLHAWQARTSGRPGYPWKLGIALAVLGAVMWPDLLYRESVAGPVGVQPIAPMLLAPGLLILLAWPLARSGQPEPMAPEEPHAD